MGPPAPGRGGAGARPPLRRPRSALQGAFWGLILGLLLGFLRLVLDYIYPQPPCNQQDTRPAVVKDVHYLYFSMVLSAVTLAAVCSVSWATAPPSREMVRGLWGYGLSPFPARDRNVMVGGGGTGCHQQPRDPLTLQLGT